MAAEALALIPYGSGGGKIVETFGYAAGSEVPVFSKTYSTDGSCAVSGSVAPGDVAALVRYSTAARSSKNHPIYGFSYYHGVTFGGGAGSQDTLSSQLVTALGIYANKWVSVGFSDGANTMKRSTASGHDATGYVVETLLTHRDLPR